MKPRPLAAVRKALSGDKGIATLHRAVTNHEEGFVLTPAALHAPQSERTVAHWMTNA